MDKIFTISGIDTKRWIEINDARTELSEIKIKNALCYVPMHIYEDSLIDLDEISEVIVSDDVMDNEGFILFHESCFDLIQEARYKTNRACIWYDEIVNKIPTADSILLSIHSKEELRKALDMYINYYPFVSKKVL